MTFGKKNIFIGVGLIVLSASVYFFLKDRANRRPIGIIDDETVDFDFNNASGKGLALGLEEGVNLSVKDYKKSIEETLNDKIFSKYLGLKIYTINDNVNVRMGANVNNGFINNIAGTIPFKKSFVGKVVTAKLGNDKKIWFAVNEKNANKLFDIKKHFSWDVMKKDDTSYRWVRSDNVILKINKKK